jgi:SAM-dependent methyltransferase
MVSSTYHDQAWLYDAAFSWDTSEEAAWLLERLGPGVHHLLEPGCGSGRCFPALVRRGVQVTGLDGSPVMLARARERMRELGLPEPRLVQADMADFQLDERFEAAYCPINTLSCLETPELAASHLGCVARHLVPGARYLVQLDLVDYATHSLSGPDRHSRWEVEHERGRIRCSWFGVAWDPQRRIETQRCRFEILSGPDEGAVHEADDLNRLWDWASWSELVEASPFMQTHAFDAGRKGRPPEVEVGPELEGRPLVWHELRLGG